MVLKKVALAATAVLIAYLYSRWQSALPTSQDELEDQIISAWEQIIVRPVHRFKQVAVGTNACVDLIVRGTELLQALGLQPGPAADHNGLDSLEELQEVFAHFFSRGAGAERAFMNSELYPTVIDTASELKRAEWFIGGNAGLMAQKIATTFPEVKVQLVGPIGKKLHSLLSSSIQVPQSSMIDRDEVHLIMEYSVGDTWGNYTAPIATRFITSYDESNSKALPLENFFVSLPEYNPDLVILSGLHMLEGQPDEVWQERLQVFKKGLQQLPDDLPVHLELASMAKPEFLKYIVDEIFPFITSVGLNEQEIAMLSEAGEGPHRDLVQGEGYPAIHKVSDIMLWILETYGRSSSQPTSRLTRVHFHCLTFHIVGTVKNYWTNTEAAVAAGTRMAGRQACDIKKLDSEKIELRIPETFKTYSKASQQHFNASSPVTAWVKGDLKFALSPVLVCRHPLKTVGLGDAISSTGLLYSEYNKLN